MILYHPERFELAPSCVMLDLDHTLYHYGTANAAGQAAARSLCEELLGLSGHDFDRCFDDARTELKRRLGHVAASHSRLLYFQRTVERAGFGSQPFIVLQLEQAFWRAYLAEARLYPGALEFLDDLRIAGVPAVVVTDLTAQIQLRKLIALGIDRYVEFVVSSEESGAEKPAPIGFELALAKLGGVEGEVWMIGDNVGCDLAGAKRAVGAVTVWKSEAHDRIGTPDPSVDARFHAFEELRRLFARLIA